MTIRQLHPLFGAEVGGIDLAQGLGEAQRSDLIGAVETYGFVVFPGQALDDEGMVRLASSMGEIHAIGQKVKLVSGLVYSLSNLDADGRIAEGNNQFRQVNASNQLWHTDSSYAKPRSLISILHGRVVPPEGGETQFSDMRAAYDRLTPDAREKLCGRVAWHSLRYSTEKHSRVEWTEEQLATHEFTARPLVHRHEPSGRMALYLASHIGRVEGMDDTAGADLVAELTAHATQPDLVYTHTWTPNDLIMWDNRCMMHRATPFDDRRYGRDVRTIRLVDKNDA